MRRDLERRLQAVELSQTGTVAGEVWIELCDGTLRGSRGATITLDAFEAVCSRLALVMILPDNGRDASRP
jgi:hypothetical protein